MNHILEDFSKYYYFNIDEDVDRNKHNRVNLSFVFPLVEQSPHSKSAIIFRITANTSGNFSAPNEKNKSLYNPAFYVENKKYTNAEAEILMEQFEDYAPLEFLTFDANMPIEQTYKVRPYSPSCVLAKRKKLTEINFPDFISYMYGVHGKEYLTDFKYTKVAEDCSVSTHNYIQELEMKLPMIVQAIKEPTQLPFGMIKKGDISSLYNLMIQHQRKEHRDYIETLIPEKKGVSGHKNKI